jgi:peptidoglycan/xylan/chitin deacetylase (PgdA/CDA1 family)
MKRIILILLVFLPVAGGVCSYGQSALLFTAEYEGGRYPLDSIVIENVNTGTSVVKHYPDTVLNLFLTDIPRIGQPEENGLQLSQNYPNPFSGITRFEISLPREEMVLIKIADGTGRVLMNYRATLPAGTTYFDFKGGGSQLLFLSVQAGGYSDGIIMISTGRDSDQAAGLIMAGTDPLVEGLPDGKEYTYSGSKSDFEYSPGDSLIFTGYITRGTLLVLSDTICDRPSESTVYSFSYRKANRIVILMYHDLVDGEPDNIYERKMSDFENDLSWLQDNFQILSMNDLLLIKSGQKELNSDGAIITFDDGYSSWYSKAFPLMSSLNIPATFFLVAEWVETAGYLTWPEVWLMSQYANGEGVNIFSMGSHSSSHPFLEQSRQSFVTHQEYLDFLDIELGDSRNWIVDVTGQSDIFLSLPFGDGAYNSDIIGAAVGNGYSGIRTSVWNSFSIREMNIFALPSIPVLSDTPIELIEEYFDF